jgi:hypothetical protein
MIDLKNKRFGRLLVVEETEQRSKKGFVIWECLCECGNIALVSSKYLCNGDTTSCGCFHIERIKIANTKHGHRPRGRMSAEYQTWSDMIIRCSNPKKDNYKDYGGRGIKVCTDWLKFENFLAYLTANNMYPKPAGMSIDRIENDGNYEPGNIRWADAVTQSNNRRNVKIRKK